MIDQETFKRFSTLALDWARQQEKFILRLGFPLKERAMADAGRVGVRDPSRVRVLVVDRIPLPEDPQLADASRRATIISESCRAVAIGHGIMVRADAWGDRELLVHQLVHVAQCERCGGLECFVHEYLSDRTTSPNFTVGALEDEARRTARKLCAADAARN